MEKPVLKNLIKKSQIIILEGARQSGKLTFALFTVKYLLQKDALIISATQEKLFNRKADAIYNRFESLKTLKDEIDLFVLKTEWNSLKEEYSYALLRDELARLFQETERHVIIFHRFGLFFEFQDRFEIETMFRAIVDLAEQYEKQVIFTISTASDNYAYMNNIMCDFSDLTLDLTEPNLNERDIQIVHSMHKVDQERFLIKGIDKTLILENGEDVLDKRLAAAETLNTIEQLTRAQEASKNRFRVLMVAKDDQKSDAYETVKYLLANKKMFEINYVTSIYDLPQYFETKPDLIFLFIDRNDVVEEIFHDLKKAVADCRSFAFFPQEFIRGADRRLLHKAGIDEIFSVYFQLDDLVIAMEKAAENYFYEEALKNIKFNAHVFDRKNSFESIIGSAYENSVYFSLFLFSVEKSDDSTIELGRKNDFVYHDKENQKIYYLALNTREFIADLIAYRLQEKGYHVILEDAANALNIEKCLAM